MVGEAWRGADCAALLLVSVVLAGCTAHPASPAPLQNTSVAASDFGARRTALTCADAVAASPADSTAVKDRDVAVGLPSGPGTAQIPLAAEVGVRLPPGVNWYFWKSPVPVRANARDVTITASGQGVALLWVPADVWTSGLEAGPWASSSVTLQSCPDRDALFLGGVLAATPDTCVVMRVESAVPGEQMLVGRLNGSPCPG